jgi:DNA-binding MarR family transcriptional regulator
MDLVPQMMNRIRKEMRGHRLTGLSVPQFRTLVYLYRNRNASLSDVADHVGLQLPTMSKTVDALVTRKLIVRRVSPEDRRHIRLRLSARGLAELRKTRQSTEKRLAEALAVLTPSQQALIMEALQTLLPVFAPGQTPVGEENR